MLVCKRTKGVVTAGGASHTHDLAHAKLLEAEELSEHAKRHTGIPRIFALADLGLL